MVIVLFIWVTNMQSVPNSELQIIVLSGSRNIDKPIADDSKIN